VSFHINNWNKQVKIIPRKHTNDEKSVVILNLLTICMVFTILSFKIELVSFFFMVFTTSLIWFGDQFCHQVVSAPSSLPSSASITTELVNIFFRILIACIKNVAFIF
jgi:hypothetical protein